MQNVLDKARTLLASYDVPIQWWWKAISYAIYCINRSPTSKGDNRSPLEQVFNITPNIDDMIPFYAPGLYHVTKEERMLFFNLNTNIFNNFISFFRKDCGCFNIFM